MQRVDIVEAILRDPSVLFEPELTPVMHRTIMRLIDQRFPLRNEPVTKRSTKRATTGGPPIVDGWISYAHAARLPGVSDAIVRVWVSRGNVQGGEGFLWAEDLLRWLRRESPQNRQQAAAEALDKLMQEYSACQG